MTIRQVMLAWAMLTVQGSRRLYECLAFSQPSKSQMWVGHWVLGIGFYIGTSVAIWIEGIRKFESLDFPPCQRTHTHSRFPLQQPFNPIYSPSTT